MIIWAQTEYTTETKVSVSKYELNIPKAMMFMAVSIILVTNEFSEYFCQQSSNNLHTVHIDIKSVTTGMHGVCCLLLQ